MTKQHRWLTLLVVIVGCGSLAAQRVHNRLERVALVDDITLQSVSLTVQTMSAGDYSLSFGAAPTTASSLITAPSTGMVSWVTPGLINTVLASNGTSMYWTNPFDLVPGWLLTGTSTTNAWGGISGAMLGPTSSVPLALATRNAAPQSIRFYTGVLAATERARVSETGGLMVGTTSPAASTALSVGGVAASGRALDLDMSGSGASSGLVVRSLGNTSTTNGAVVIGSTTNGLGTALRVGVGMGSADPSVGIEVESALPIALAPTTTATGTGIALGSALLPWTHGAQVYATTPSTQIGRGLLVDASSASTGLAIGVSARGGVSPGPVFSLVTSSSTNADVYLGSSSADVPVGLALLSPGAQTSTARMHHARVSGSVVFRGTGTGVTTITAGDQGGTSIAYVLPPSGPTASNTVLVAEPGGTLSWADASGLADVLMEETPTDGDIVRLPSLRTGVILTNNEDDYSVVLAGGDSRSEGGRFAGMLTGDRSVINGAVCAVILSGVDHLINNGNNSAILGGAESKMVSSSVSSFVGAGWKDSIQGNTACGIVTGASNVISSTSTASSFVGTGVVHHITGSPSSAIVSGMRGVTSTSSNTFIGTTSLSARGSGSEITNGANQSAVLAGNARTNSSIAAFVGCGYATRISSSSNRSAIVAGGGTYFDNDDDEVNIIDLSTDASILGGIGNVMRLSAHRSVTLAGRNTTIEQAQVCVFANQAGSQSTTITTANVTALINAPLIIASNSGSTSELRLYEGQASTGLFPTAATNYVGLKAAHTASAHHTYVLPQLPSTAGRMLSMAMVPPFNQLVWIAPSRIWSTAGEEVTSDYSSLGPMVASTNGQPLIFATRSATAQDIRMYGASLGATEYVRISGTTGGVGIGLGGVAPTRTLDVSGTSRLGESGTTIPAIISGQATLDLPNIASGAVHVATMTVANADPTAAAQVTPRSALPNGLAIAWTRVSATGTVAVAFYNLTGADIDHGATDFSILVVQ